MNHTLFWANLCPASSPSASDPEGAAPVLTEALKEVWGSLERFKESMGADLLGIQGSGWGWLVCDEGKRLRVVTTRDQDIVPGGLVPVLGVDMWEHAYYLQVCCIVYFPLAQGRGGAKGGRMGVCRLGRMIRGDIWADVKMNSSLVPQW